MSKSENLEFRKECDQERNATFLSTDVDLNGILELDEYKQFCKSQVENISKRVGVKMQVADEKHMEIAWNINQFEGKGGITPSDFKTKVLID